MKKINLFVTSSLIVFVLISVISLKTPAKSGKKHPQKEYGFWLNDEESALKEATKLKKPILIDFYGIWCPPCNQLDELVFSTKEFQKASSPFVLLKMDADNEKSWLLKSKYKVGGYPTLIFAKVDDNQAGAEIDRLVGFYPKDIVLQKMKLAQNSDGSQKDETILSMIKDRIIDYEIDQDSTEALKLAQAGLILKPDDISLKISKLKNEIQKNADALKSSDSKKILEEVNTKKKNLSFYDLISAYEIKPQKEILDEMLSRVNPSTMYVDTDGYNEADIYAYGMDLADAEKNEDMKKTYLNTTLEIYEKLLKKYGEDSRSLNLSYSYYLKKSGQVDKAIAVLQRMIQKYPQEFTFHYKLAKLYIDEKNYPLAKEQAEKALEYSYGDNKIYSMETLLDVALGQKDNKTFLKQVTTQADDFLKSFKGPGELKVRTHKYLNKLIDKNKEAQKALN